AGVNERKPGDKRSIRPDIVLRPTKRCTSAVSNLSLPALRYPIDRRGSWNSLHGILLKQLHCFLHRAFKLRIVSLNHIAGSVLDFYIRGHAFVLDGPLA